MILRIEQARELLIFCLSKTKTLFTTAISGDNITNKRRVSTLLTLFLELVARWIAMQFVAFVNYMT